MGMPKTTRDELVKQYPKLAEKQRKGSRSAAVVLNCIECMGGEYNEAANCTTRACFLWPFGPAALRIKRRECNAEAAKQDLGRAIKESSGC